MTLKDQLATDMDVFFNSDEFAEDAVYQIQGGESVNIQVIPEYGENLDIESVNARALAKVSLRLGDLSSEPARGDTITFGGNTWSVMSILESDGYVAVVEVRRDARLTFNRGRV